MGILDSKNKNINKNSKFHLNSFDLFKKKLFLMFNKSESSIKFIGDFNRILCNPFVSTNIKTKMSDIYLKTVVDSKDSFSTKIKCDTINNNIYFEKEIEEMESKIYFLIYIGFSRQKINDMKNFIIKLLDSNSLYDDHSISVKSKIEKLRKRKYNRGNSNLTKRIFLKKNKSQNNNEFNFDLIKENCSLKRFSSHSPLTRKCQTVMKLLNSPNISFNKVASYDLWTIKSKIKNRNYSRGKIKNSGKEEGFINNNLINKERKNLFKNEINKLLETKIISKVYLKPEGNSFEEDSLDKDLKFKSKNSKNINLKIENVDDHIENYFKEDNYKTPKNARDDKQKLSKSKKSGVMNPSINKNQIYKENDNHIQLDFIPTKNSSNNLENI